MFYWLTGSHQELWNHFILPPELTICSPRVNHHPQHPTSSEGLTNLETPHKIIKTTSASKREDAVRQACIAPRPGFVILVQVAVAIVVVGVVGVVVLSKGVCISSCSLPALPLNAFSSPPFQSLSFQS